MTPAAVRGYRRRQLLLRSSGARSRNSVHRARPGVSVCDSKRRSLPFALRAPLVRLRIRRLDVAVRPFERGRWRDTRASCQRMYLAQRRKMRSGVCGALGRRNRIKRSCGSPTWSGLQSMPSRVRSGLRSRSLVDVLVEHSAHGLHPQ